MSRLNKKIPTGFPVGIFFSFMEIHSHFHDWENVAKFGNDGPILHPVFGQN